MSGFLVTNIYQPSPGAREINLPQGSRAFWLDTLDDDAYEPDIIEADMPPYIVRMRGAVLDVTSQHESTKNVRDHVTESLARGNPLFFAELRGTFCGLVISSTTGDLVAFTNQLGDQPVYYHSSGGRYAVGTDLSQVTRLARTNTGHGEADGQAVISLLTYGFLQPGQTVNAAVRRIRPGQYIRVTTAGRVTEEPYHKIVRPPMIKISLDDAVDQLDALFRAAIQREFEHDLANRRSHIADLSGGLDARMVSWVARDIGYGPFTNLTYSQSGFIGLELTQQLSRGMGNHLIVSLLDDAGFLLDFEKIVSLNHGSALYSGITGGHRVLESLNWRQFGIEHTGQLGDVIVGGSYLNEAVHRSPKNPSGLYSTKLAGELDVSHVKSYEDHEMYMLHVRGLSGILSTHITRRNFTPAVSAFLDLDVMEFCLSLPPELRYRNRLYRRWMTTRYPSAAKIPNDNTRVPVTAGPVRTYLSRARQALPRRIARIAPAFRPLAARGSSMNPFDLWFAEDPTIGSQLDLFADAQLSRTGLDVGLREAISRLYNDGSALEKTMAITALASCDQFV